MRSWHSLVSLLPRGRSLRRQAQRELALASAYHAVFVGKPTDNDQNLVLLDLADKLGFYKVTMPAPGVSLEFYEGRRSAFGIIFGYLSLSEDEWRSLREAAHETASQREYLENSNEEG